MEDEARSIICECDKYTRGMKGYMSYMSLELALEALIYTMELILAG